jgi:hypothetical protein
VLISTEVSMEASVSLGFTPKDPTNHKSKIIPKTWVYTGHTHAHFLLVTTHSAMQVNNYFL